MRVPLEEHTARPWRIHDIAPDFEVEDVWALPTIGGPDDFDLLMARIGSGRPGDGARLAVRLVWAVRWKLGEWLGWDHEDAGLGTRVDSLRERLPEDLRNGPRGPELEEVPFNPLYRLDNEYAAEIANRTVHGVMHLGWVEDGQGRYRGQMAVLVKPNATFGRLYMTLIKPFRYALVYPALMRHYEQIWQEATGDDSEGATVTGVVGTANLPSELRSLGGIEEADYADAFTINTDLEATPEQWARAMFGDTPGSLGTVLWRGLLGLRLVRTASPDAVAGWRIAGRGDEWIRLQTGSRNLTASLVVRATDGQMSLATFMRYDRPAGTRIWTPLSAVHRRLAPGLLRATVDHVRARSCTIWYMLQIERTVAADSASLWKVISDLDHWDVMLPTVDEVTRLSPSGPITAGTRFRVRQPGLAPAEYVVTDWRPDSGFTWVATGKVVRTTAFHELEPDGSDTRVLLGIEWAGPGAWLARRLFSRKTRAFLNQEADAFTRLATSPEHTADDNR